MSKQPKFERAKEKSLKISKGIQKIIQEFIKKELPKDVIELLQSKAICFGALSTVMESKKL